MNGWQFWLSAVVFMTGPVLAYVVGYRTGWTDGKAQARKFADR